MDFSSPHTAKIYTDRTVDDSWSRWCSETLSPAGKDIVDIGCGGGIYSGGFVNLGAKSVVGIDGSEQYIRQARGERKAATLRFEVGTASKTGLPTESADVVFERALVHHLSGDEQLANALEARRLLRAGGVLCVQDRTYEDVESQDEPFWIRTALFRAFPHLLEAERARRPSRSGYTATLGSAGFAAVKVLSYPELRRTYASFEELEEEILARKGKSILFELTDADLRRYCRELRAASEGRALVETDLWTVWLAAAA